MPFCTLLLVIDRGPAVGPVMRPTMRPVMRPVVAGHLHDPAVLPAAP